MYEFFHGWRRKLGVVTLVMACVAMGGWVRSQYVQDTILLPGMVPHICIINDSHGIQRLILGEYGPLHHDEWLEVRLKWLCEPPSESIYSELDRSHIVWRYSLIGFDFGEFVPPSTFVHSLSTALHERVTLANVPHWSVVIPLTLLSAWLLLSKPRKPTPKQPPVPAN